MRRLLTLGVVLALAGCGNESCPSGYIDLGAGCIDMSTDRDNCGGVGIACGPGFICENGICVLSCPEGMTECEGVCRDLQTDIYNCGMCGLTCASGNVCVDGSCTPDCPEGYTNCTGVCKNLQNDPANCGDCGNACASGEVCFSGTCTFECPEPYIDCSGSCADLDIDHLNCGACGAACLSGQICDAGTCANSCLAGLTLCSGACADLMRDPENCGSCATRCGSGDVCYDGTCIAACPGGFTDCSGSCRDLNSDRLNCGACETECVEGEICDSGTCTLTCDTGLVDCSGVCSDLANDPDNCGTCGTICAVDEACVSGSCAGVVLTGAPFYALPYDYFAWDAAAADLLFRAVTYGWGSSPRVGTVQECADMSGSTSSTSPGGPYAGEYHATIGALEYAGLPSTRIVELADAAAASAALGTYDVLLFMETERCALSATAWRPVVTSHLASGGRVVITCPFGSNATFINDLGMFGTGSYVSVSAPYTAVSHPFWTGITHPGYFSATGGWSWSGSGLVVLGHQTSDASRITVFAYHP